MNKAAKISKLVLKEATLWLLAGVVAFQGLFNLLPYFGINVVQPTQAAVAPNATVYYGDLNTPADKLRFQNYTDSSNTFGGEINTGLPSTSSGDTNWIVAKPSPVRNEQIQAFVQDGTTADLFVTRCVDNCDAAGDFSSEWSNAGVGPVLACDTTQGSCAMPFDLGYEQLKGRAMVVYGDNATATDSNSKVYYCYWDGSAWGPVSNCAPTDGTNDLPAITGFNGIPRWIRVTPEGEQLTRARSDRIIATAITATGIDLAAWIWDGDDWTTLANVMVAGDTIEMRSFDAAWETLSGDAILLFGNSSSEDTTPGAYRVYNNSTNTWDSSNTNMPAVPTQCNGTATDSGGYRVRWVEMESSPSSDIILAALNVSDASAPATTPAFFPYHWDGSAWNPGGGTGNSTACDESIKTTMNLQAGVRFEKYNNGTEFGIAVTVDGGTTLTQRYTTFTAPSTWAALATIRSTTDDSSAIDLYSAYNAGSAGADRLHTMGRDWDCDSAYHDQWTGSAWSSSTPTTGSIPPNCTNAHAEAPGYTWVTKMYAAWQKNWRWYKGTDTASVPTDAWANENTRPTVGNTSGTDFRLRMNYAELTNGASETASRKKLQYVSAATCSDPNSCASSSWTDVDDIAGAGIWRYTGDLDITCSPTDCDDGVLLTGTVLTGTNGTCSAGNGCGIWVLDKDGAGVGNMDHNANIVQENEYIIENNGAAASTIYYFRIFDVHDNTVIFRQQDSATTCAGSSACTYPSLDTSSLGPTTDDIMRHGNWFSGGTEQGFFWAN